MSLFLPFVTPFGILFNLLVRCSEYQIIRVCSIDVNGVHQAGGSKASALSDLFSLYDRNNRSSTETQPQIEAQDKSISHHHQEVVLGSPQQKVVGLCKASLKIPDIGECHVGLMEIHGPGIHTT